MSDMNRNERRDQFSFGDLKNLSQDIKRSCEEVGFPSHVTGNGPVGILE